MVNIVPVEEVLSLRQEAEKSVFGAIVTDASQMVETVGVLGKPEVVVMPSTETLQEMHPTSPLIEAVSTIAAKIETLASDTTMVDVSKEAEKREDKPVNMNPT
jgi:hypothetical protein